MAGHRLEHSLWISPSRDKHNPCGIPLSKKYRSHFEIIASILDAVKNMEDRYFIMKMTSINYAQLNKYLTTLAKIGFVKMRLQGTQIMYQASEEGMDFLRQYSILAEMLLNAYAQNRRQPYMSYDPDEFASTGQRTPNGPLRPGLNDSYDLLLPH